MSVNKVFLLGRLGGDPEVKKFDNGQIANFNLATNERYTDRNGERQEVTDWHRIVVRNKQAEIAEKYLSKGKQIFVEGRIKTRQFEDKEGNTRYITEVQAVNFQMLGGPGEGGQGQGDNNAQMEDQTSQEPQEDDLPF